MENQSLDEYFAFLVLFGMNRIEYLPIYGKQGGRDCLTASVCLLVVIIIYSIGNRINRVSKRNDYRDVDKQIDRQIDRSIITSESFEVAGEEGTKFVFKSRTDSVGDQLGIERNTKRQDEYKREEQTEEDE